MADILLRNGNIQGDQDALNQVLSDMDRAIDEFVNLVRTNLDLFLGSTREAAVAQLNWLTNTSNGLIAQFGSGNQALNEMVRIINTHDARAANVMGGS